MTSKTTGAGLTFSNSVGSSTETRETDAVMPSEIAHLPGFAEGGGLHGFLCQSSAEGGPAQAHKVFIPAELLKLAVRRIFRSRNVI